MNDMISATDPACIKESDLSIARNLTDIKFLLRQIPDTLEKTEAKQGYE